MEAKYLINISELARCNSGELGQQVEELVRTLLQLRLKNSAVNHVGAEHKRFGFWSKISLAALVAEGVLLPLVYQSATPLDFGLYLALPPTTAAAYKNLRARANVCRTLQQRLGKTD